METGSGGVTKPATAAAPTMKYVRKDLSCSIVTIFMRANMTTAIGTSNATPKAMNMVMTKSR